MRLKLRGPDLADVFPVLGVPAPPTPPYKLEGRLLREGEVWKFEEFAGIVGDSDLEGSLSIDYGRKKPFLTAKLNSKLLDLDDLGPLIGLPPKTEGKETASGEQKQEAQQLSAGDNIFPDVQLNVDKLKVMDMDVTLDAKKVNSQAYFAVASLKGHVKIDNGKAIIDPVKLGVANGDVAGRMSLDSNTNPASVSTDLDLSNFDLAAFFKNSKYFDATTGKIDGHVLLSGVGRSLADVMGTTNGKVRAVMNRCLDQRTARGTDRSRCRGRANSLHYRRSQDPNPVRSWKDCIFERRGHLRAFHYRYSEIGTQFPWRR